MAKKRDLRSKIVINETTSPRTKIFGVRLLITYNFEKYLRRGDLVIADPKNANLFEGLDLAKRIFEIDGVQVVMFDQYDIYVTIGRAFDWLEDEIELNVHKVIRQYLETASMMEDISGKNDKKPKYPEK